MKSRRWMARVIEDAKRADSGGRCVWARQERPKRATRRDLSAPLRPGRPRAQGCVSRQG